MCVFACARLRTYVLVFICVYCLTRVPILDSGLCNFNVVKKTGDLVFLNNCMNE